MVFLHSLSQFFVPLHPMKTKLLILMLALLMHVAASAQVSFKEQMSRRLDVVMTDTLLQTTQVGIMVWDLTDDACIYAVGEKQLMRMASTMKLLTAITALDRLGFSYKYTTSLYYKGSIDKGVLQGDIICKGGMDPLFSQSDMKAFAQALKGKGIKSVKGRLITDSSMKEAEKWGEGWCWDDKNPILSPLLIEGKANFAVELVKEMRAVGIVTTGLRTVPAVLPKGAELVATCSHTIDEVLKDMMKDSDNLFAESTYYQIAASTGKKPASARDAQKVEYELLRKLGLNTARYRLADGSGLSLYNYLPVEAQIMLLRYAWQKQELYTHLLASLPISGKDGTLKNRMKGTVAEGKVQAKTGTVTGISALSGYLTAANGHRLCFCVINQGVHRAAEGRVFQDRICEVLCAP